MTNKDSRTKTIPSDSNAEGITVPGSTTSTVPWSSLFYTYASRRDRVLLICGLICSFVTGFLIPISYIFLGDIANKNNQESVSLSEVLHVLYVFVGNLLVATLFAFFERWCLNGYAENLTRQLRERYIYALLHHEVEYIESKKPSILGQVVSEESSRIINGLGPSIGQLVRAIATFLAGVIIGFSYSWQLTILTLIAAPVVIFAGSKFASAMGNWIETQMHDHKEADSIAEESIRNYKTVTALGAETYLESKYVSLIDKCKKMLLKALFRAGAWKGTSTVSTNIAIALVFCFTTILVYYQRRRFPEELFDLGCQFPLSSSVEVCFSGASLTEECMRKCEEISQCWYESRNGMCLVGGDLMIVLCGVMNSFIGVGTAFSALQAIQKTKASAACFVNIIEHKDKMDSHGKTGDCPSSSKGDIVYKDVDFKYASRDAQILKQLNLTIHENEVLGIVGESGSGKSTILKLLLRLYLPTSGSITWDGKDVSTISIPWIRDQISYVAQEPVLFSGTIRENLMYGRVGCTEEEMVEAAKLVEADAFIRSFPNGYDTYVGELGTSLSGGQKQRIAIARALIRHPRVLVLDEATSALDSQSEKIVQNAMEIIRERNKSEGKGLSIVIVAHRLSSIRSCDRIVVMDEGHIVEEGSHEELLSKNGVYAALYKSQEKGSGSSTGEESPKTMETEEQVQSTEVESKEEATEGSNNKSVRRYRFSSIYTFFGKTKWVFWVALIGVVFTAIYPAGYGIVVSLMYALPFRMDVDDIWRSGLIFSTMMVVVAIIYASGDIMWWDLSSIVKENTIVTIRSESFKKLLSQSVAYYDEKDHTPAAITSELSIDVRKLRDFMDEVGSILESIIILVLCLIISFSPIGSWELTCISLVACPLLFTAEFCQNKLIANVISSIDKNLTEKSGEVTDALLNIHTIHAYNLQDVVYSSMMKDLERTNKLCTSRSLRTAIANIMAILFPMTYMVIIFTTGTFLIQYSVIDFQQLMVVYNTIFLMASYMGITMGKVPNMTLAQEAAQRVFSVIYSTGEKDKALSLSNSGADGAIVFNHVSFTYPTRPESSILKDVSFTIPKGSSVAFVGPSGCGKSTIISLIQRMYKPVKGEVLMNGVNVESVNLDSYRSLLGAVNQEPCMFSGTIRENLLMGVNREVSESELEEVCRQALCMDFINEMPDRFDTDLGTTGKSVSGGQKQRLALARAILRNPHILLLDEATSALDSENQDKFLEALNQWRSTHPCTVVTVAHRLSTIMDSDTIFVVHDGVIVASGTHEELLQSCEFYGALVRGQMGNE